MTETTNTPEPDEQGTFVGGTFGRGDDGEPLTTAQEVEAQPEEPVHLAAGVEAPAQVQEDLTEHSDTGSFPSDVEGTATEPAPGDRNEPV